MANEQAAAGEATQRHTIDLGLPGYRAEREIGRGGFAVVYRAVRVALRQTVAIKLLLDADKDPLVLARFERERMALGTLAHHPHIVTVYDGGVTEDGTPFLAMEYVRDGSLADRLHGGGPLALDRVLDCGVKLAGALETAHRAGVLHRDVKPENVLVSGYGQPLLADFGIAQVHGGSRTKSGVVTASIAHAPPEILDGAPASPQADVYSLGSTLFSLLAGAPTFSRPTDHSMLPLIARVLTAPVPDLRERGVPPAVCGLLEWAMAKHPGQRHVLIHAGSLDEARERAQRRGERAGTTFTTADGHRVRWSFVQVVDVSPVLDTDLTGDADLYARFFRDHRAYRAFEPLLDGALL